MVHLAQITATPIVDSVMDLLELIEERAKPTRDMCLPILLTLLKEQLKVSHQIFDNYDGKLCRAMMVLA